MKYPGFALSITALILLWFLPVKESRSQRGEFGLFVGMSYYNGELNPAKQFANVMNPAFGILYDYHINSRYSWRIIGSYGKLTGSDDLTDIGLNNFRGLKFETRLLDFSGQLIFNFLEFGNTINVKPYTPYIFIGIAVFNVNPKVSPLTADTSGTAFPKEEYSRKLNSVSIPFGVGFKATYKGFTLGIEWNFRKTFTDKIDGLDNQYDAGNRYNVPIQYNQPSGFQKGIFSTFDWYSFAGITLSYRPQPKKNACPGID